MIFPKCNCGGVPRRSYRAGCDSLVPKVPPEGPDLAIYCQELELSNGNLATWNSPDISTNHWGPFRLMPEAIFKVRNLSERVSAIGAMLHYATSPFGIGTLRQLRLSKRVNLAPASEIEARFPLDPQTFGGDPRVGVHLTIEHPHDSNLRNNFGSQVHDQGFTSQSGRQFTINVPVRNDSNFSREMRFSVLPTDLECSISMSGHVFSPQEQSVLKLTIDVPSFLSGSASAYLVREVTLVARLPGNELIGGVTRIVCIDN